MSRNDWGHEYRRGSYDDYDHSDEELYVDDQWCANCRFFRKYEAGSECTNPNLGEFDLPADNGTDWCENWEGRSRKRGCR